MRSIKYYYKRFIWICKHIKLALSTYDFDHGYLDQYHIFFLEHLLEAMVNGYAIHEEVNLKALRLTIKLIKKTQEPYFKFYDLHVKKWGERQIKWIRLPNGLSEMRVNIEGLTEAQKLQEHKELIESYNKDTRMEQRDSDLALKIMIKYRNQWWD